MAARKQTLTTEQRIAFVENALGHSFATRELVVQAITHPSAVEANPEQSYERLEFLGDSIVGFTVGLEAYRRFPTLDEGALTKMRIAVVNGTFLTSTAADIGLSDVIIFGASELVASSRGMRKALEDVFEALTAALYLDAGIEVAQAWVLKHLGEYIDPNIAKLANNPKSDLQEYAQAKGSLVEYRIIAAAGPSHAPTFTAEALVDGEPMGTGAGSTKREAEAQAAATVLLRLVSES